MKCFTICYISTFLLISKSYTITDTTLTDLETINLSTEVAAWGSPQITSCNGTYMVGGYNSNFLAGQSLSRNYTSIPIHNYIFLSLDIYRIDSWDSGDKVTIFIDRKTNYSYESIFTSSSGWNYCGASFRDRWLFTAVIHLNHSGSSLEVRVRNDLDQGTGDESVGFRNLKIIFLNATSPMTDFGKAYTTLAYPISYSAPCSFGYYYNVSYIDCLPCDLSCSGCTGGTNSDCLSCNPIGYYNSSRVCLPCDSSCYSCTNSSSYNCTNCTSPDYLFPNGQCLADCPIAPDFGTIRKCNYYCMGTFLYPNGSCNTNACFSNFTLVNSSSTGGVCSFVCGTMHLYANGSCVADCPSPFTNSTYFGGKYCHFPCSLSTYYYQNASCLTTCDMPFFSENISVSSYCNYLCPLDHFILDNLTCVQNCNMPGFQNYSSGLANFCKFTCPHSQYFYFNNSCRDNCPFPFMIRNISVGNYCIFPCFNSEYFYQNGSCLSSCPTPFLSQNLSLESYCYFPCSTGEYYYENGTCTASCETFFNIVNTTVGLICRYPCLSTEYLYKNGSCLGSCPSPFISANRSFNNFCYHPCEDYFYNRKNKSCGSVCGTGYVVTDVSIGLFCDFKCRADEFYLFNGSCVKNCSFPYLPVLQSNDSFCYFRCPRYEYYYIDINICNKKCESPNKIIEMEQKGYFICSKVNLPLSLLVTEMNQVFQKALVTSIGTSSSLLAFGFDPYSAIIVLTIMQTFFFTLFYNVEYPEIVKTVLGTFGVSVFNFLPNPVYWFVNPVPDISSPKNFYDNKYNGYFFFTAFQSLLVCGIVLIFYAWGLLGIYLRRPRLIVRVGKLIHKAMDRSFFLRFMLSIYMQLLLSALLQIRIADFSRVSLAVGYIFAGLTLILSFMVPLLAFYSLTQVKSLSELGDHEVFVEDYDLSRYQGQLYGFLVIFKKLIHAFSLVLLYYYPILQCLIPWLTNLFMIAWIARYYPHHRLFLNVFDFVNELGLFGIHTAVLGLAVLDSKKFIATEERNILGVMLLVSIALVFVSSLLGVWIENFYIILRSLRNFKLVLQNGKRSSYLHKPKKVKAVRNNKGGMTIVREMVGVERILYKKEIIHLDDVE